MPLRTRKAGDCRGTEADGTPSPKWCSLCFADGRFVDPDCTLAEMLAIVDDALARDGAGAFLRRMARRQVPRLERWRRA
jgi:hypothetical protein